MKNVVMIAIDDLNDWTATLQGYSGKVYTPNLDSLMGSGTTFTNAFAQTAICNPSRTSILTGLTPLDTGVLQNQADWEAKISPGDLIFGKMKAAGYETYGFGKLFHTGPSDAARAVMFDHYDYLGLPTPPAGFNNFPVGPVADGTILSDEARATAAINVINNADPSNPLFLSVGFDKPHISWIVPQKYFDLYPLDEIVVNKYPDNYDDLPDFIKDFAGQRFPWGSSDVPDELTFRKLTQGYLASITYMDEQLGRVVAALENSAIGSNSVIVAWSDHGYHLGDRDFWHKFTLWDNAGRAPLIIKDLSDPRGQMI